MYNLMNISKFLKKKHISNTRRNVWINVSSNINGCFLQTCLWSQHLPLEVWGCHVLISFSETSNNHKLPVEHSLKIKLCAPNIWTESRHQCILNAPGGHTKQVTLGMKMPGTTGKNLKDSESLRLLDANSYFHRKVVFKWDFNCLFLLWNSFTV